LEEGIKSSFTITLIRTIDCWIPANASANQGPEQGGLMLTMVAEVRPLLAPHIGMKLGSRVRIDESLPPPTCGFGF
jgi:hypothetical protein